MRQAGFSRLELCLTLGLLTALAAVTVPTWYLAQEEDQVLVLETRLEVVREAIADYVEDHEGHHPGVRDGRTNTDTFVDQLSAKTDAVGTIHPNGKFGPYLTSTMPENPFNGMHTVWVVTEAEMPEPDDRTGWMYHAPSRTFRANSTGVAGADRKAIATY